MEPTDSFSTEALLEESSFRPIRAEDYPSLGIEAADVPLGTFPSFKHPSQLQSRFGGNAYGLGLFEVYDRLDDDDVNFLQSIDLDNKDDIRTHYNKINQIYKRIGLLIRFSSLGRPYYLIPFHLLSNTLIHIQSRINEIIKIINHHRKKFLKEHLTIALVTQQDDLIVNEVSYIFHEHDFILIDSIDKFSNINASIDLIIFTRDVYEIIQLDSFSPLSREIISKKRINQYIIYLLLHAHNLLKEEGELYIIANHHTERTNRTTEVIFKNDREHKKFLIFSHIFKTKRRYRITKEAITVNIFDLQNYLSGLYVEQEIIDKLLRGRSIDQTPIEEIEKLPYLDYEFSESPLLHNQAKIWEHSLSIFFGKIFLRSLTPESVTKTWAEKFVCPDYSPTYLITYLGQKRPLDTDLKNLLEEVSSSRLAGCQTELLADYRDSFEYVLRTLRVIDKLRKAKYRGIPQSLIDRLRQPLENKARRYPALNDVLRLTSKINRLRKMREYLNPDGIEGSRTRVLKNLPALRFYGFSHSELREIALIVLSHTPMGRVISGKMNEKALRPLSDLARTQEPKQAFNLLRYCRLMTMAETEAARQSPMPPEQVLELFELYEYTIRVVTNRDIDWDRLLDEKITSMGGIRNRIIRKILKMMNQYEFLDQWQDLGLKGPMEKEALADYDPKKVARIEDTIQLVKMMDQFEEAFLKTDSMLMPGFYRKFFDIEFHGTGHLFQRMESRLVFILLWIAVNITQSEIINFNPILADLEGAAAEKRVRRVEKEVRTINTDYLSHEFLRQFSQQLYQQKTTFVIGTGFEFKVNTDHHSLEISYIDIDFDMKKLEVLNTRLEGACLSQIPADELEKLDSVFAKIGSFYFSHVMILRQTAESKLRLPARQERWFKKAIDLKTNFSDNFIRIFFKPDEIYTNMYLAHRYAPHLLTFILPELASLDRVDLSGNIYLKSPILHYIIATTKKLQALITHQKDSFHDLPLLHRLAVKEFGPMATGIVGISESQIGELETMVARIAKNLPLYAALIKAFILQDVGRIPELRSKYSDFINPADLGSAGAYFLEKEPVARRLRMSLGERDYLIKLVRYHSLLHHVLRGEFSFLALQQVLAEGDLIFFDAFFILSFIMLSAIREDLLLEDLAEWLFTTRATCHLIMNGETTLAAAMEERYALRGKFYYALEGYHENGLPEGVTPWDYLTLAEWEAIPKPRRVNAGKMIFAMERILRLRGIRYVEFEDLANLILKTPLEYVYKRRKFSSIGYATFEKEVFEALRIYNTLQALPEPIRHFLLSTLVDDDVRIFWYERVSNFLSYDNQIKLLILSLMTARRIQTGAPPVFLDLHPLSGKIEKRYEALNDYLHSLPLEEVWEDERRLDRFLDAGTGLMLKKESFPNTLSVDFTEDINIAPKLLYMQRIDKVGQLKDYFHYTLRSLRRYPFYTDDYELELEKAYDKRLCEINDMVLKQADTQMALSHDFEELWRIFQDLAGRSWEIGLSEEQKQRLGDLYGVRKDNLRREKLAEIEGILNTIHNRDDLRDYWNSIKPFLLRNRDIMGKEFENLIARKFDQALLDLQSK